VLLTNGKPHSPRIDDVDFAFEFAPASLGGLFGVPILRYASGEGNSHQPAGARGMAGSIVPGAPGAALLCDAAEGIVAEMARQIGSTFAAEAAVAVGGSGMH
jgi:hypothetical protein